MFYGRKHWKITGFFKRRNRNIKLTKLDEIENCIGELNSSLEKAQRGVKFIDKNIQEEIKKHANKEKKTQEEIASLTRTVLNIDVYQRRKNLRLFEIPEQEPGISRAVTAMVLKGWLEHELDLTSAYSVIQPNGKPRPIISHFLNYSDAKKILELRKRLPKDSEFNFRPEQP